MTEEIAKLKLQIAKQQEIIKIQTKIIDTYQELLYVTTGNWSVKIDGKEICI